MTRIDWDMELLISRRIKKQHYQKITNPDLCQRNSPPVADHRFIARAMRPRLEWIKNTSPVRKQKLHRDEVLFELSFCVFIALSYMPIGIPPYLGGRLAFQHDQDIIPAIKNYVQQRCYLFLHQQRRYNKSSQSDPPR